MITVKELRELLKDAHDNDMVILASDEDGNSFSPLDSGEIGWYVPESSYRGEAYGPDDICPSRVYPNPGRCIEEEEAPGESSPQCELEHPEDAPIRSVNLWPIC